MVLGGTSLGPETAHDLSASITARVGQQSGLGWRQGSNGNDSERTLIAPSFVASRPNHVVPLFREEWLCGGMELARRCHLHFHRSTYSVDEQYSGEGCSTERPKTLTGVWGVLLLQQNRLRELRRVLLFGHRRLCKEGRKDRKKSDCLRPTAEADYFHDLAAGPTETLTSGRLQI